MPFPELSPESRASRAPWYLLWVFAAILFAATSVTEFLQTGKISAVVNALAWICLAFSWFAKPFYVDFRAKAAEAIKVAPLRSWVSPNIWNSATLVGGALVPIGLFLKFIIAA